MDGGSGWKSGRRFYEDNRKRLSAIMRQLNGLDIGDDEGSGEAVHGRPAMIGRGHEITRLPGEATRRLRLLDNELRATDPFLFLRGASGFFSAQARVLHEMWRGFPEFKGRRLERPSMLNMRSQPQGIRSRIGAARRAGDPVPLIRFTPGPPCRRPASERRRS